MSANLILHWALDRLQETSNSAGSVVKKTLNRVNNDLDGLVSGDTTVVPDEKFGSCLQFDGDQDGIELSNNSLLQVQRYTIEAWIKPKPINNSVTKRTLILSKGLDNYGLFLGKEGYIEHKFKTNNNGSISTTSYQTNNNPIVWDKWQHVAITNNGTQALIYINGELQNQSNVNGSVFIDNDPLFVGKHNLYNDYEGKIAHIRLYDDALTQEQINTDMEVDETTFSAFLRKYPIDFELYNQDSQHVLFIEDGSTSTPLYLDIINSSLEDIELKDIGSQATSSNYHFELRFRPDTLADSNLDDISILEDDWNLARKSDGTALYLLYKGSNKLTLLQAGKKITLQFTSMSADAGGGNRSARVEFIYKNINYHSDVNSLRGYRLQHLNIVNHLGRRNLPLHISFVGGNTVLSDGVKNNTLKLRFANISNDNPIPLSSTKPSRIRISFDVQPQNESVQWALTNSTAASGVNLSIMEKGAINANFHTTKSQIGRNVEWTIVPQNNTSIKNNKEFIVTIENLIALNSIGHANLYFNFENIDGYQDEKIILVVNKLPVLYSNNTVVIGDIPSQQDNQYRLKVSGDTDINGRLSATTIYAKKLKLKDYEISYNSTIHRYLAVDNQGNVFMIK